jgi:hypothetical protein
MLVLCIRRTLPWHDPAAALAAMVPNLRPRVVLWDATFDIPYTEFRRRMAAIALDNMSRVANAKVARLDQVPPGALVVPTDDDDWFSPELAERVLEQEQAGVDGYHWKRSTLEAYRRAPRWRLFGGARERRDTSSFTCATNNYALRYQPEHAMLVMSHVQASEHFDANAARIRRIDASLSVQNRNVASQSALGKKRPSFTREDLLASLDRHRKLYRRLRLPPELAWAKPYADAMRELTEALRVR